MEIWPHSCLPLDLQHFCLKGHFAYKVLNSLLRSDVYAWPFSENTPGSNRHTFLTNTWQMYTDILLHHYHFFLWIGKFESASSLLFSLLPSAFFTSIWHNSYCVMCMKNSFVSLEWCQVTISYGSQSRLGTGGPAGSLFRHFLIKERATQVSVPDTKRV